MIQEWMTEISY